MADLSQFSDDDLRALASKSQGPQAAPSSLSAMSDADLLSLARTTAAKEPAGTNLGRMAEFGARGFVNSALDTVGALPDVVSSGMRAVGLPTPGPDYYKDKLKSGFNEVGKALSAPLNSVSSFGPNEPTGPLERGAYGAGRGVADAASFMVPGAVMARTAQAGSTAANVGRAMASQPVMQSVAGATGGAVSDATGSDLAGLGASLAVPTASAATRRAITPVGRQLAPEEQRLATLAEQMGIRLTPGQATGSVPLQTMESSLAQLPFSAGPQHAIYDAQRTAFNRAALNHAGINADRASPAVLDDAFRTIGAQFDDVIRQTPQVNIDGAFAQSVRDVERQYGRRLPTDVRPVFDSYMDDINQMLTARLPNGAQPGANALTTQGTSFPNVSVDGQTYQNISSDLRKAARNARNNPALHDALTGLQNALDDAMGRSVPRDVAGDWAEARRSYRNLLQIDNAMATAPAADQAAGNLPLNGFANAVRSADRAGYSRGRGEMNDTARVGKFLASTNIPDSGTAQRSKMVAALTGAPLTGGGGALLMGADPVTTAATVGATYGLPRLVQALANSQGGQAYLRNNLLPGGGVNRELLAKLLAAQEIGDVKEGGR